MIESACYEIVSYRVMKQFHIISKKKTLTWSKDLHILQHQKSLNSAFLHAEKKTDFSSSV